MGNIVWPLGVEQRLGDFMRFLASLSFRPKRFIRTTTGGGERSLLRTISPSFARIPKRLPAAIIPFGKRVIFWSSYYSIVNRSFLRSIRTISGLSWGDFAEIS